MGALFQRLKFYAGRGVLRALRGIFLWLVVQSYVLEHKMTTQNECKHEGMDGKKFCSSCGKEMVDDGIERVANRVVEKLKPTIDEAIKSAKTPPKPPPNQEGTESDEPEYETELDRVLGRPKPKKEKK